MTTDRILTTNNNAIDDDETSNVLKRSVTNMLAHVLALCFILRLLKCSHHYAPINKHFLVCSYEPGTIFAS